MENLYIRAENFIPEIDFDAAAGVLNISGESYHEYTLEFFQPVFEWLKRYFQTPNRHITVNFRMTYYNTSTSRRFLEMLDMMEEYQTNKGGKIEVNWHYKANDVDMMESGEEYREDTNLTINLLPY
ncbi:MAG: DUF1987 domain-containing protein [Bernardetiaceae bacterium]|jgi:hypothetical protein|nr:DUF1987 domain-containing protein [Bernardetiaceae bacterium]